MIFIIIFAFLNLSLAQEFLNDVAITFSLSGTTSYVPSTGGVAIPGYTFNAAFSRYQWLGITAII